MAEFTTALLDLQVLVRIGIHPHELGGPQRVIMSVWMTVDYGSAPVADEIAAVVDYDFVREGILALAKDRHFNLQETLCETVAVLCFRDARVHEVRVRSAKPDIYPDASVGCEIVRRRGG